MSDFGSYITLTKKDKSRVTDLDKETVKAELEKIKKNSNYFDVLGEPFLYEINEIANNQTRLHLVFSKYWYGEGDIDENFEFAKNNDFGQVKEIAEKLKLSLESKFNIEPNFENW